MAYITGAANSLHELAANFKNALINSGGSAVGNAVHLNDMFISFTVSGNGVTQGSWLEMQVGVSFDGTNPVDPVRSTIGPLIAPGGGSSWGWPVVYHLHILDNPFEAFLLVEYSSFWQILCFGQSPASGCPGMGVWGHGSLGAALYNNDIYENQLALSPDGVTVGYGYGWRLLSNIPFALSSITTGGSPTVSRIHAFSNMADNIGWSAPQGTMLNGGASSLLPLRPLLRTQPNAWNLEATLLPCDIYQGRLESKSSLVGSLAHMRITRNDYLSDGAVVVLGADRWKVYPAYRRNTAQRDGANGVNHSGTMAIAIRYDGP